MAHSDVWPEKSLWISSLIFARMLKKKYYPMWSQKSSEIMQIGWIRWKNYLLWFLLVFYCFSVQMQFMHGKSLKNPRLSSFRKKQKRICLVKTCIKVLLVGKETKLRENLITTRKRKDRYVNIHSFNTHRICTVLVLPKLGSF